MKKKKQTMLQGCASQYRKQLLPCKKQVRQDQDGTTVVL